MGEPLKPVDYTSFLLVEHFEKRLSKAELLMAESSQAALCPQTGPVYLGSLAFLGESMLSPIISDSPGRNYDFWDLFNDGDIIGVKPSYLSVYSNKDGLVNFAVTDETKGKVAVGDILRRPRVSSTGNAFLDAMSVRSVISRYLRFSSRSLPSDQDATIIEGPTENQPFLVVRSKSGKSVVQQDTKAGKSNVEGLIFTPVAGDPDKGDCIGGTVELWGTKD